MADPVGISEQRQRALNALDLERLERDGIDAEALVDAILTAIQPEGTTIEYAVQCGGSTYNNNPLLIHSQIGTLEEAQQLLAGMVDRCPGDFISQRSLGPWLPVEENQ